MGAGTPTRAPFPLQDEAPVLPKHRFREAERRLSPPVVPKRLPGLMPDLSDVDVTQDKRDELPVMPPEDVAGKWVALVSLHGIIKGAEVSMVGDHSSAGHFGVSRLSSGMCLPVEWIREGCFLPFPTQGLQ